MVHVSVLTVLIDRSPSSHQPAGASMSISHHLMAHNGYGDVGQNMILHESGLHEPHHLTAQYRVVEGLGPTKVF